MRARFQEDLPPGTVAYTMEGIQGTDAWKNVTVVFHAGKNPMLFTLGPGAYKQVVTDTQADVCGFGTVSGTVIVKGISAAVFVME